MLTRYAQETQFPRSVGEGAPWTPFPAVRCPLAVRVLSGMFGSTFWTRSMTEAEGIGTGHVVREPLSFLQVLETPAQRLQSGCGSLTGNRVCRD